MNKGFRVTNEQEQYINNLLVDYPYEAVVEAMKVYIVERGDLKSVIDRELEVVGKEIAEAIVVFACVNKKHFLDEYWKENNFTDIKDNEYKLGLEYIKNNQQEMLELYNSLKLN